MAKKKMVAVEEEAGADEGSLSGRLGEFGSAVMQIADEKGISKERVLEVVEAALAAAYKKDYGKKGQVIHAKFDEVAKSASFFLVKEVVDETTREFVEETEVADGEVTESEVEPEGTDEDRLPRFNSERDMLLSEAKKIKKDEPRGNRGFVR